MSSFIYGAEALGVSDSTLLEQGRLVAVAVAFVSGGGGQDLDLALMVADGGPKGMADPAFPAHIAILQKSLAAARLRLAIAVFPWLTVKGPAAAFTASVARLKWTTIDAVSCVTDKGRTLNLLTDPPAAVTSEVAAAVR